MRAIGVQLALLLPVACAAGCADFDLAKPWNVESEPVPVVDDEGTKGLAVGFDQTTGTPRLGIWSQGWSHSSTLGLPEATSPRWGIKVVDASALPSEWRPRHAPEGGVLVSQLRAASPLAYDGLEVGDLVLALQGEGVASPASFVAALNAIPPGSTIPLRVRKPTTERSPVQTRLLQTEAPGKGPDDLSELHLFWFGVGTFQWTQHGSSGKDTLFLGVFDWKNDYRVSMLGVTQTERRGALFGIFRWSTSTRTYRGQTEPETHGFTLFGFKVVHDSLAEDAGL
jgi:hypothetical protein